MQSNIGSPIHNIRIKEWTKRTLSLKLLSWVSHLNSLFVFFHASFKGEANKLAQWLLVIHKLPQTCSLTEYQTADCFLVCVGGKQPSTLALTGDLLQLAFCHFYDRVSTECPGWPWTWGSLPQTPKQQLLQGLAKTMYSYYQHYHSISAMFLFYLLLFVPAMPIRQALYPEALSYHRCPTFDIVMYKCVGPHHNYLRSMWPGPKWNMLERCFSRHTDAFSFYNTLSWNLFFSFKIYYKYLCIFTKNMTT